MARNRRERGARAGKQSSSPGRELTGELSPGKSGLSGNASRWAIVAAVGNWISGVGALLAVIAALHIAGGDARERGMQRRAAEQAFFSLAFGDAVRIAVQADVLKQMVQQTIDNAFAARELPDEMKAELRAAAKSIPSAYLTSLTPMVAAIEQPRLGVVAKCIGTSQAVPQMVEDGVDSNASRLPFEEQREHWNFVVRALDELIVCMRVIIDQHSSIYASDPSNPRP